MTHPCDRCSAPLNVDVAKAGRGYCAECLLWKLDGLADELAAKTREADEWKAGQELLGNNERLRTEQRDRLATDALCALSAAGIATPEKGFIAEPETLRPCIERLARRADANELLIRARDELLKEIAASIGVDLSACQDGAGLLPLVVARSLQAVHDAGKRAELERDAVTRALEEERRRAGAIRAEREAAEKGRSHFTVTRVEDENLEDGASPRCEIADERAAYVYAAIHPDDVSGELSCMWGGLFDGMDEWPVGSKVTIKCEVVIEKAEARGS